MAFSSVACQKNDNKTQVQELDTKLIGGGPVDQEKKKILDGSEEFGNITYKISNAWKSTEKDGLKIYVLNDENPVHIQIGESDVPEDVPEKDYLELSDAFLDELFQHSAASPFLERTVGGETIHGKRGSISVNGRPIEAIAYIAIRDNKIYRFTIMSHISLEDDDVEIFKNMLDSVEFKQ